MSEQYVLEPLADRKLPPMPNFRKFAGDPRDPKAFYPNDHVTGLPAAKPFGGVRFTTQERPSVPIDEPPEWITITHDMVEREHWIEKVNPSYVNRAKGPKHDPMREVHTLPQAEQLIFHMADGDHRYRVVHQPDKRFNDTGEIADVGGDPNTHVDWFYVAQLVKEGDV